MGHCMSKSNDLVPPPDPVSPKISGWTHLAWSGGAAKGILHAGAYRELWEAGVIHASQGAAGTSIGSIFATFACMGIEPDHVRDWIMGMDTGKLFDNSWCTVIDVVDLVHRKGFYRGNYLEKKCEEFMFAHTNVHRITLGELWIKTGRHLKICVSNVTQAQVEYWDHISQPGMPVSRVIRTSASMPILYDPVQVEDDLYCDGGLCDNFPIDAFGNTTTLGILLLGKYEEESSQLVTAQPTGGLLDYAMAVYGCAAAVQFGLQHKGTAWCSRTIALQGPTQAQWNADLTASAKRFWIAEGARQTSEKIKAYSLTGVMP